MNTTRTIFRFAVVLAASMLIAGTSVRADDGPQASSEKEKELLAVLRSDAPAAEKAITCKLLAIHGSSAAVADLARLLPDPQLSSWARTALEAIPGAEADEALRAAAGSLEGLVLIGVINSIGVRADAGAVETLSQRLSSDDPEIASAAAVALGSIGNADATASLRPLLTTAPMKTRSAVAEGCVLCAERLHAAGKSAEAAELYDEIRTAELPKQRILEATRGAVLARGPRGIPLLLEQLRSSDKAQFQMALSTAREYPGAEVDRALAAELARARPDQAALLLQAMADRPETVVLTAVLQAAEQGPRQIRLSALEALARVGDASCVAALLRVAVDADPDLAQPAKSTLANLADKEVDAQILAQIPGAEGRLFTVLLDLVGQRRIPATETLVKALNHTDKTVRAAALTALGETIALNELPVLVRQVVSPRFRDDVPVAEQALKAASVRMPDREACAAELAAAYERTPSMLTKNALLEILGAVGGTKALSTLGAAAKTTHAELQDTSTRLLGEWMTADAAPVLLDLAKTAPGRKYQIRALRGYIRIARQFDLTEQQRIAMCQQAFAAASQAAEQKLVLDVLKRYPTPESLKLAVKAAQIPEIKEDATQATLAIAQSLAGKGIDVREQLASAGLEQVKVEIIKAQYGAGSSQKDVTAVLRKHIGDLPLIALPSRSYNTSFGGDPLPGSVKQLRVQYRLDGKSGEASFAEDAVIILPTPK